MISQELATPNDYADFWRYNVGVNVIPANNYHDNPDLCKKPFWTDANGKQNWIFRKREVCRFHYNR